jgi:chromosome partitioning protein
MSHIFAITNQKGGVGKTTTTVNLAASLAHLGQRVLVVDIDPQGNATTGCGVDKQTLSASIYPLLLGQCSAVQVCQKTAAGFDILPTNRALAGAEVELIDLTQRERRLKDALAQLPHPYDYVLIDCPPALNMLTLNGLTAAQAVIIPMQCEYYALEGLSDLVTTIKKIRSSVNPALQIEGLLRTMFDPRNGLAQQVSEQLQQHFGSKVYQTVIPRNVKLAEAPSYGLPALLYAKRSNGAKAYLNLAQEILQRHTHSVMGEGT